MYKRHNFAPNHPESKWDLAFHFILFHLELDKRAYGPTQHFGKQHSSLVLREYSKFNHTLHEY